MANEDEKGAHQAPGAKSRVIRGFPGRRPGLLDFYDELFGGTVDITLYIPVLNEEDGISGTLDTIAEAARQTGTTYEVHVFDDASTDRTALVVERYMEAHPEVDITLVRHERRRGIARNCYDSAFLAKGRYHRIAWGDNVEPAETFVNIFRALDKADVIVACHRTIIGKSRSRILLSRAFATLVRLLSGHKPRYYNGGNCYRRSYVLRYHTEGTGFGFQAELLTRVLDQGASFVEADAISYERKAGRSKALQWRNWVSVGWSLTKIFVRRLRGLIIGRD
jgi:glycosyltransferase involved in cell wall biosynthesis